MRSPQFYVSGIRPCKPALALVLYPCAKNVISRNYHIGNIHKDKYIDIHIDLHINIDIDVDVDVDVDLDVYIYIDKDVAIEIKRERDRQRQRSLVYAKYVYILKIRSFRYQDPLNCLDGFIFNVFLETCLALCSCTITFYHCHLIHCIGSCHTIFPAQMWHTNP